jgi:hypothetical protein
MAIRDRAGDRPAAVGRLGFGRHDADRRDRPDRPDRPDDPAGKAGHERSTGLWATVNICNTRRHPDTIGIRAQMPALGFATTMEMVVTLGYYTTKTASFKPLATSSTSLKLGQASTGYHQDGVTFTIKPPAMLNATVQFTWSIGSKVLGTTTRTTVSGRKGVQQGDPPGYSSDICRIS